MAYLLPNRSPRSFLKSKLKSSDDSWVEIQRLELDGVPVFWAPGPGPLTGCLMFRVGQADETLLMRGSTHLIEHLALAELDAEYPYNGMTSPASTSFVARGSGEEVAHCLNHVARALSDLPWHRLEAEAQVLRAEAASKSRSAVSIGAYLTLGPNHLGLIDLPELALDTPDPNKLDSWRRHFFTRHNCALWFSGPEPPPIDLSPLPDGKRLLPAEPRSIRPVRPHLTYDHMTGVSGIAISRRTAATNVACAVLSRRLTERLRGELGIAYGASVNPTWTSANSGLVTLGIDCAAEHAGDVHAETTTELTKLAYYGSTDEELTWFVDQTARVLSDPAAAIGAAAGRCEDALFGRPTRTTEQHLTKLGGLTSTEIAVAAEEVATRMLWMVPETASIKDHRAKMLNGWSETKLKGGKKFSPKNLKDKDVKHRVLSVSPEGVMFIVDNSQPETPFATMLAADIVALRIQADGTRTLFSRHAKTLTIGPAFWQLESIVADLIDALVPPDRIVRANAGGPPPPTGQHPPAPNAHERMEIFQ